MLLRMKKWMSLVWTLLLPSVAGELAREPGLGLHLLLSGLYLSAPRLALLSLTYLSSKRLLLWCASSAFLLYEKS